MKDSHFVTPRRLSDATFQYWADPIEADPSAGGAHPAERVVLFLAIVAIILLALGVA